MDITLIKFNNKFTQALDRDIIPLTSFSQYFLNIIGLRAHKNIEIFGSIFIYML